MKNRQDMKAISWRLGMGAALISGMACMPANALRPQTQSAAPADSGPSSGWHRFGERGASAWPAAGSSASIAALEKALYEAINRDRADPANRAETGGQALPLRWNDELAAAARAHSRDMVQRRYFGHVDPEGRSPGLRLTAAGIAWQSAGENIAMDPDVKSAEAAFMNEPHTGHNHRSNILSPRYTEVGVGIARASDGELYITEDFMRPPDSTQSAFARPSH